jgi:hypothetical protein
MGRLAGLPIIDLCEAARVNTCSTRINISKNQFNVQGLCEYVHNEEGGLDLKASLPPPGRRSAPAARQRSRKFSASKIRFNIVRTVVRKRTERETPANGFLSATVCFAESMVSKRDKSFIRRSRGQESIR